jgi:hypothetical protein
MNKRFASLIAILGISTWSCFGQSASNVTLTAGASKVDLA